MESDHRVVVFMTEGHPELQKKDACLTYKSLRYFQKVPEEEKKRPLLEADPYEKWLLYALPIL